MEEKFLPIGTVCRLKNATKYLMITGFCVKKAEEDKVYDYLGCMYPQGVVSTELNFMFNHEQIEEIAHKGLVNDLEYKFKQELASVLEETNTANKDADAIANMHTQAPAPFTSVNNQTPVNNQIPANNQATQNMFNTINFAQQNNGLN